MANATLTWSKSPSSNVNKYTISWTLDGNPAAVVDVPQSASGDSGGYSTDFNSGNPGVTLKGGDVVDCTIVAVDTVNGLTSTPVTPPAVTVPTPPAAPEPPAGVALVLS